MRFNATLNVDFAQWRNVKLERENNMREFRGYDEETPKFGAGSEYNREMREEARRKKFGINSRKYKPDAQPWILKVDGKSGKKFRGIREGGVGENAAFYVFTHAPDGAIEAYPLNEWYNFQPIQRYKALSAEEAEHEFSRRKQVQNYFSLMLRKRLKGDDDDGEDPEEAKLKLSSGKKNKELKISDMDEWIDSDDDSETSGDEDEGKSKRKDDEGDSEDDKKKKKAKKALADKKKNRDVDDEAFEESDDGDEEGREMDYISDSSEQESDPEAKVNKQMTSVAEEDALRNLLTSDEESEEEKKSEEESGNEEKAKEAKEKESKDKKKKKLSKKVKSDKKESLSDFSSDSSDSEGESKPPAKAKKISNSTNNSRSASPSLANMDSTSLTASGSMNKRKATTMLPDVSSAGNSNGGSENSNSPTVTPAKKPKYEAPSMPSTFAGVISSKE